jgi:hypothetical protein
MSRDNLRELPDYVSVPEEGISTKEMYRVMYTVVSQDE